MHCSLSLADGISAELESPRSLQLSSTMGSLLRFEESNVLAGPTVYPCIPKGAPKRYKNHQNTCQHPPMNLQFLNLCFSGIFVPRSDRPALARAPFRFVWETQKKGESWLAARPTGNPGINTSGLFGFPRLASIDCLMLQTCWEGGRGRDREGETEREREKETQSLNHLWSISGLAPHSIRHLKLPILPFAVLLVHHIASISYILYVSILFLHSFGIIELQSAGQKLPDTVSWRLIEDISVYNLWSPTTCKQSSSQKSRWASKYRSV